MSEFMITYERALEILSKQRFSIQEQNLLLENCHGHFLAEDITADRDFPPFDRVAMDGIALKKQVFEEGSGEFPVESVAPAGTAQKELKDGGSDNLFS